MQLHNVTKYELNTAEVCDMYPDFKKCAIHINFGTSDPLGVVDDDEWYDHGDEYYDYGYILLAYTDSDKLFKDIESIIATIPKHSTYGLDNPIPITIPQFTI